MEMSSDDDVDCAFNQCVCPVRLEVSWGRILATFYRNCNVGPIGGGSGAYYNDGMYKGITTISVTADSRFVKSLQLMYAKGNGNTHTAPLRGWGAEKEILTVFNYPSEKLQRIRGYCRLGWSRITIVKCVTSKTNLAKYGPCGEQDWVPFELDLTSTSVAGFHGRTGDCIDSIALHTL